MLKESLVSKYDFSSIELYTLSISTSSSSLLFSDDGSLAEAKSASMSGVTENCFISVAKDTRLSVS